MTFEEGDLLYFHMHSNETLAVVTEVICTTAVRVTVARCNYREVGHEFVISEKYYVYWKKL